MAIQYDGCSAFYSCFYSTLLKKPSAYPCFLFYEGQLLNAVEEFNRFYIRDLKQASMAFVTSTTALLASGAIKNVAISDLTRVK